MPSGKQAPREADTGRARADDADLALASRFA
jgi:hypothetical protein